MYAYNGDDGENKGSRKQERVHGRGDYHQTAMPTSGFEADSQKNMGAEEAYYVDMSNAPRPSTKFSGQSSKVIGKFQ